MKDCAPKWPLFPWQKDACKCKIKLEGATLLPVGTAGIMVSYTQGIMCMDSSLVWTVGSHIGSVTETPLTVSQYNYDPLFHRLPLPMRRIGHLGSSSPSVMAC